MEGRAMNKKVTILPALPAALLMMAGVQANASRSADLSELDWHTMGDKSGPMLINLAQNLQTDPMPCAPSYPLIEIRDNPRFECQKGDKIFSDFMFPTGGPSGIGAYPAASLVKFAETQEHGISITFARGDTVYGPQVASLFYRVTVAPGAEFPLINSISLVVDKPGNDNSTTEFKLVPSGGTAPTVCNRTTGAGTTYCPAEVPTPSAQVQLAIANTPLAQPLLSTANFFCENPAGCGIPGQPASPPSVPEPTSLSLLLLGLAGVGFAARRRPRQT